jgi:hypothetical protein
MKVRIYYEGYENIYLCQYKKWGIWWNFTKWFSGGDDGYTDRRIFMTMEEAKEFLASEKTEYLEGKKLEAAAKERDKKSGVVHAETW